jgi:hypothetical protein
MPIRIASVATCGFCEYIAGTRECAFIRRGPLVSSLVNRTQYETGALLIIPNRHFPTVLDVPPETLGASDPTRIYLHTAFSPISIAEQHAIAARIRRGCELLESNFSVPSTPRAATDADG